MRPLFEFGIWDKQKSIETDNSFRGDINSGTCEVFASPDEGDLFSRFPPELKKRMVNCCYIDDGDPKYFKIYSMTCIDYKNKHLIPIDERMREFGNKTVLIKNFDDFLKRIGIELLSKYEPFVIMCDRMVFYDFKTTKKTNPFFEKYSSQRYQNELRIALGLLDDISAEKKPIRMELTRLKLEIGSIEDIAELVNTEDLINGNFPISEKDVSFPGSINSLYERINMETKQIMSTYKPQKRLPKYSTC